MCAGFSSALCCTQHCCVQSSAAAGLQNPMRRHARISWLAIAGPTHAFNIDSHMRCPSGAWYLNAMPTMCVDMVLQVFADVSAALQLHRPNQACERFPSIHLSAPPFVMPAHGLSYLVGSVCSLCLSSAVVENMYSTQQACSNLEHQWHIKL